MRKAEHSKCVRDAIETVKSWPREQRLILGPTPTPVAQTTPPVRTAKWILERDTFLEPFIDRLTDALVKRGRDFYWLDYAPFGAGMSMPAPGANYVNHIKRYDDCIVVYGSINLVRRLMRGNPWFSKTFHPTAWITLPNLECRAYYSHWRKHMLVRQNAFATWRMLRDDASFFFDKFAADGCIFVKPNENLKLFTGKVVSQEDFEKFQNMEEECYGVPPDALCVVATPCKISAEWRFLICDRKVITGSRYRLDGKQDVSAEVDKRACAVAWKLAKDPWQPDPAYVADIAKSGDEYGLLEIGSANCAGMYDCDAGAFVDALSALAEKEYKELNPEGGTT